MTLNGCFWGRFLLSFNDGLAFSGHEDVDQYFSQVASLLSRSTFDNPNEVVELLDSSYRPEALSDLQRKQAKKIKVSSQSYKLDTVACWKNWVGMIGIRLLGLRLMAFDHSFQESFVFLHFF